MYVPLFPAKTHIIIDHADSHSTLPLLPLAPTTKTSIPPSARSLDPDPWVVGARVDSVD